MELLRIPRQQHRVDRPDARPVTQCEVRGYCGPFANEALYDAFPEPMWHGMADCLECGTTCHVPRERHRAGSAVA